jgi:hypothetical protein
MARHWTGGLLSAATFGLCVALSAQVTAGQRGGGSGAPGGDGGAQPAGRGGRGGAPAAPAAPTPRRPDGTVNLGPLPGQKGFWNNATGNVVGRTGNQNLPTNLTAEEVPFRPWAKALYEYRRFRNGLDDPHARCQPPGGIRFFTVPNGMEFIQQPELQRIFMIAGENREWRRVGMEPGRKHPPEADLVPSYFGDSIGWWEGDTLVVDTVGFQEKFWMIRGGLPHTKFLHLTERFTRLNYNQLRYEVTIDDKGAYTRTWSGGWIIPWQTTNYDGSEGGEIHEYFCIDNERDSENLERH